MSIPLLLAAPESAHVVIAASADGLGTGRTVPTVAAVLGLLSVIIGGRALARSAAHGRDGTRRGMVIATLASGLTSVIVGGLHAATSAGGFGTGNGLAGAIVALVLGLIGTILGGLALARTRSAG